MEIENRARLLAELQSELGRAVWQTQALEDTLAHLIAIALDLPAGASLDEAEQVLKNVRKQMLGRLLRRVREVIHFDDSFEPFINRFLDERNWLIHRSWRMSHGILLKPNEYRTLRIRVRRVGDEALELNRLFAGLIESWARERGVDEQRVKDLEEEFLNVWSQRTAQ